MARTACEGPGCWGMALTLDGWGWGWESGDVLGPYCKRSGILSSGVLISHCGLPEVIGPLKISLN